MASATQAKVTIESLTQMAEILRQSADDILGTKEQMDNELYNIPWDDPIGLTFISKYEEDFKPLKEKLIPNINNYIQYMKDEGLVVSEYSGESIGGLGVIGAAGAGAAGATRKADVRFAKRNEEHSVRSAPLSGLSDKEMSKLANKGIISYDEDPANVDLSEEDYKKLRVDPSYKERYVSYLAVLRERQPDFEKGISAKDIDEINSAVFGLKEDELDVAYPKLGESETLGGKSWGNKAFVNKNFLDSHPNSSHCGVGAIGAHECSHVIQRKIYQNIYEKWKNNQSLTKNEIEILKTFNTEYSGWSEAYHNDPREVDSRISQYAFRDACNQYVLERYYSNKKP